jgi:RNA polymerase sigma-70 factor, ECF subfamily
VNFTENYLSKQYFYTASLNNSGEDADFAIIGKCRNGDINSFQVLVERYQKKMLNISYRMLDDYDDACDVVQESFISAYKALSKFRGDSTFSAWITAIVMNHSRNRLKQRKIRTGRECVSIDTTIDLENESASLDLPAENASAHDRLEKMELQRRVQACINSLSGEYKDVVILRDLQEFSYDEISSILNLAEGTVKSRLFRARDSLKDCLSDVIRIIEGAI